jgi:P-type Cu+ transporter
MHVQMEVHMVTGDNWRTARSISEQLGVVNLSAEVKPDGKERVVRALQGRNKVVAMVGDGVNDAPALAAADVGIAIGSGTEIAVETADYVLIRSDLEDVVVAFDLSKKTFSRIKQNYVWAMIYNVVMVPFAGGVFYPVLHVNLPPMFAGLAMALSSVSVVLSSLMLMRYRRPKPVLRDFSSGKGGMGQLQRRRAASRSGALLAQEDTSYDGLDESWDDDEWKKGGVAALEISR